MRVIVYFGFTVLSILIQFCVMDFIHDQLQQTETQHLNVANSEENYDIKDIRSNKLRKSTKANFELKQPIYSNTSRFILPPSTTMTSTILDIFYDENISTTDFSFTTELYANTEVDNVTEINFPVNIQPPTLKPDIKPRNIIKDCTCNLLYEVCDINCCCDSDCSYEEQNLFHCNNFMNKSTMQNDVCQAYLFHNDDRYRNNIFDNMFCVAKINLPEKRKITHKKFSMPHQYLKWRNYSYLRNEQKFTKEIYKPGDPLWLAGNGSISYIDLPCPLINNYCSKRKPVAFFMDEEIECIVKLEDLEIFHILNVVAQTKIISASNSSMNSSSLNCSTLYCANWTAFICDNFACEYYNKSLHQPSCTGNLCTNIALTVDYTFYTRQTKIVNATVKLYVQNVSTVLSYVSQKIRVNFLLTNTSVDEIVKYSGNPGYQKCLRVITSRAKSNYTEHFYNSRHDSDKYFSLPGIRNGQCLNHITIDNFITFGVSKRLKCRYVHTNYKFKNNEVCRDLKDKIQMLLFSNNTIAISSYGNPKHNDDEWIQLKFNNSHQESVYGKVDNKANKILCYNLITKISLSFSFTRLNGQGNKILSVEHQVVISNKSFTIENNMSIVIGMDISFIDVSKPAVFEYASNPHLDINLPKDFFFPSNKSHFQCNTVYYYVILVYCHIIIFK